MEETKKKSIKGIRIRTVSYGMIFISAVLYVLLIVATVTASKEYNNMTAATDDYITCQNYAAQVADGSNYLTEHIRLYVVTMQPEYMEAYFTEANVTRRRESALEALKQYDVSKEAFEFLETALDYSNKLMEREIYATKLIALSENVSMEELPEEVRKVKINAEDENLTPEEMVEKARIIIFGTDYQDAKALINANISYFVDSVINTTHQKQQDSLGILEKSMSQQKIFISFLFVLNLLTFSMIILLIVKPLQLYINCIKEERRLDITGSYEFKYLALTYNDIYEVKASHEALLRHRAEHDPLTGLINRGAFDQIKECFRLNPCPLALLIIDVDKFKLINDGYGHEVGDQILKKVAAVIKDHFRAKDYPARIGGDEFAVIITEVTEEMKDTILNKAKDMNELLTNPTDGLPAVSLSIGGAFCPEGFSNDLYANADSALYIVKENGRCGCRFYEEKT